MLPDQIVFISTAGLMMPGLFFLIVFAIVYILLFSPHIE
jgi:hypothetical protein